MQIKKEKPTGLDFSPALYHFNTKNTNAGDKKWRVLLFIETTMN